jgi:hypothetical protein
VKFFGVRDSGQEGVADVADQAEIISRLDSALTSIFSEDGKRTVLYYMSEKYGLTLEQASADPGKLERALTGLLGEVGWMVVKRAILEHFWEKKIPRQDMQVVASASLREAFGFMKGFKPGLFLSMS